MSDRVLLIDDDPRLIGALRTRLEASGYQVHSASCGEDGLAAARRHCPHVIILDIRMSGMDGYEVCRQLKADPQLSTVPVIVISAIVHESSQRAVFEAGAYQFLAKPYEAKLVLAAIRAAIERRRESNVAAGNTAP